jgi:RNA polymerase sigma-70 factor, ECF subfamily
MEESQAQGVLENRAAAGDRDALAELLQRVGPKLRETIQQEIGSRFQSLLDADDVLQVSFLECFLRIGRFEYRGPDSFERWLAQISRHNLLDAIRSLERASQIPTEKRISVHNEMDSSFALLELLGSSTGTPSRQAMDAETHLRLRAVVAQLPRDYEQVVSLYDLQGGTVEETAKAMGRTPGAIYMLRARALDYLRDSLGSPSQV